MELAPQVTAVAYDEVANKIGLSLGIGLLVGLEREWAQKEVGVRTFAIIALLGTLASVIADSIIVVAMLGIFLTIGLLNAQSMLRDRSLELTTSVAMMVVLILGALVGQGHYFTAAMSTILLTMLLAWKVELARFADALKPEEIRGAVLLGLLTFVIYPLLPNRFIDPFDLVNPRQAWVTVVAIAGIGFVNYVLLRLYSMRGLYYGALLGGMVNSTATVSELAASFRGLGDAVVPHAVAILLLTNVSMFLRNLILLGIFSPPAITDALMPLVVMAAITALFVQSSQKKPAAATPQLRLDSPVSLVRVLKFGGLFLGLASVGTLAQRHLGSAGFLAVSLMGGLVSSASTTATAGALASSGQITPETAGIATVLSAMSSALVNMPLVRQQTHAPLLSRRLTIATVITVAIGLAVMLSIWFFRHRADLMGALGAL